MTFDNGKTIIRLRLNVLIASVIFIVYLFFAYFDRSMRFPFLGISESVWTTAFIVGYLLLSFYPVMLKYRYIYFSDDGPRIIIRYYSVGIIRGKKSSVEIPKKDFRGYARGRTMLGMVPTLTLSQQFDRRVAQYPPIFIGSLTGKEKKKLYDVLDQYS